MIEPADKSAERERLKMKRQTAVKIVVDVAMTAALLLLMAFELIGRQAHEWIGTGMIVLFVVHHILNRRWTGHLLKGKYTPVRVFQTVLVFLVLICILSSVVSGIVMSRYVFDFLPIEGGRSWARIVHMLAAYWGFVCMSLHLGVHWNMMMGMAGKALGRTPGGKSPSGASYARTWLLRIAGILVAGYGVYAFVRRGVTTYMFLRSVFVFFDYEEPLLFFYVDYIAVMGLFVWIGHYLAKLLRRAGAGR